jgi:DnaJ-class molecular chaperone
MEQSESPAEERPREDAALFQVATEETASTFLSAWPPDAITAASAGAVAAILAVLGLQAAARRVNERIRKKCPTCGRMLEERSSHGVCGECDGTGKVEKELSVTAECPHCKGEGKDPCHVCEGMGRTGTSEELKDKKVRETLPTCETCKGTGAQPLDKEGNPPSCCECHGEGEAELTKTMRVTCERCGGSGKAA